MESRGNRVKKKKKKLKQFNNLGIHFLLYILKKKTILTIISNTSITMNYKKKKNPLSKGSNFFLKNKIKMI